MENLIENMAIENILYPNSFECSCGKIHSTKVRFVEIGRNAIDRIIDHIKDKYNKLQIYCDRNTYGAAGEKLESILKENGISYSLYIYPQDRLYADAGTVGQAAMNLQKDADLIIGVGTGTINDTCKIMSSISGKPYIIVGTAPSMDGFASDTSSMVRDGLKVSIPTTGPLGIIADTEILAKAPARMIAAGVGDLFAKYVSICEWRISNLINDEYYCSHIAQIMRNSIKSCIDNLDGIIGRNPDAIENIVKGLILSGMAMEFAEVTRPASGMEHYFSHIWDMRSLEFGYEEYLHGEQVGIGTILALKVYEQLRKLTPDRKKAVEYVKAFDYEAWKKRLQKLLGNSSNTIIALEAKEGKYSPENHLRRIDRIIDKWSEILEIIEEELPSSDYIRDILISLGANTEASQLGIDDATVKETFLATKDIRDKYIGSRLLFDIGEIDYIADTVFRG